jgi:hypothetical protein
MRVRAWNNVIPKPNPHPALRATFSKVGEGRAEERSLDPHTIDPPLREGLKSPT